MRRAATAGAARAVASNPSMLWSILSKLGRSYRIEGGGKLLAEWPAAG